MFVGAILCFVGAAVSLIFAFRPKDAFYFREGWKFKEDLEPSDAYTAFSTAGGVLAAVVLVGLGVASISWHLDDKHAADQQATAAAVKERCLDVVLPQFKKTIKWKGATVANPDEVKALGKELSVDVDIKRSTSPSYMNTDGATFDYDDVIVSDPKKPGDSKELFTFGGEVHHLDTGGAYWDPHNPCY